MPHLFRRHVEVVHYAVIRHNGKSLVFVVKGDCFELVVYFYLTETQVVVEKLGHRLEEA